MVAVEVASRDVLKCKEEKERELAHSRSMESIFR
jgi:hypothetical protein